MTRPTTIEDVRTAVNDLGLPVSKEVLDCQTYLLRVDGQLNMIAFGLRDLVEDR